MQYFSPHHCIERAKKLIEVGDKVSLRYAALELRMAMEFLTYEKLDGTGNHIPKYIVDAWQPPQAVKALLEFDQLGDKSFKIFAGIEEEYGKPAKDMKLVGEHKSLGLKWLRKHYNKVGKYLHGHRTTEELMPEKELKSYLQEVAAAVEEANSGNIRGAAFIQPFDVTCEKCGQPFVVAKSSLKNTKKFYCFNANCRAEYHGELTGENSAKFRLLATTFDCAACNAKISVENRHLKIGFKFKCGKCNTEHELCYRQWAYVANVPNDES